MARNVVICCDGTSNQFGAVNTNVVRLAQVLEKTTSHVSVYYDPGIGTLPGQGVVTRIGTTVSKVVDLAFATSLASQVEEAYTHLMNVYEPDDKVFMFGFSRGAYTVRVLAGLLHTLGLLPAGNENLVPYLMQLYTGGRDTKSQGRESQAFQKAMALCDDFRSSFSRGVAGTPDRRFPTHFVGLWDTVSSVGWVWEPQSFPFTRTNESIHIVRHAVSLDERRTFFRQNLFGKATGQDLQELWFSGVHADVGGGYPKGEAGLARASFEWIVGEAEKAGLAIDRERLRAKAGEMGTPDGWWKDDRHESLAGAWWVAEVFPKKHWSSEKQKSEFRLGLARPRFVQAGALLHWSLMRRINEIPYDPPNLSRKFIESVRKGIPPRAGDAPTAYVP